MARLREHTEEEEERRLSPWACLSGRSAGRLFEEPPHPYRTAFQRDRDRVLHSTAFRRLQYKTQVFVFHEGDHFRSRLTHTLEAAQIARTIARALGANEDLTEAIVLAHDLGHTPFGHSGEQVLHRLLEPFGGFEHNRQSLRIVDFLEVRSTRHRGLNLSQEMRAGLLKHGCDFPLYRHPVPLPDLHAWPSLEAQVADCADGIAYHTHDVDDGLRSGLLAWEELSRVELWSRALERAARGQSEGGRRILRQRAIVAMIDMLASDLIEASAKRLVEDRIVSPEDVLEAGRAMVGFSDETARMAKELAGFLGERMYGHYRVARMGAKAERMLEQLWEVYMQDPRQLPPKVFQGRQDEPKSCVVADYLAGMTDRFAMAEYHQLFDAHAAF